MEARLEQEERKPTNPEKGRERKLTRSEKERTPTRSELTRAAKAEKKANPLREAKAHLKYVRISPRKVQVVLDLIRGKEVELAGAILKHTPKSASLPLLKLLKSAQANSKENHSMDPDNLYVAQCFVTPGPILKRMRPVSKGRGFRILKRTSHVTIVLKERELES